LKKIAVLAPDFSVEHCTDFMQGVSQYFKDKDALVYFTHAKFNKFSPESFDYQYWSSVDVLKAEEIQAYIVISGVFCTYIPQNEYCKLIDTFDGRPVISASIAFPQVNGCYSVINECKTIYHQIVEHLVKEHNCKRIAFLSANGTGSSEALERYEAYKSALKEFNIPYDDSIVFDGHFSEHEIRTIFREKFKSKKDVTFDAIISANDVMAVEAIKCLNEIDVSCPGDVKIFGFDDSIFANMATPRLSTVNQNIIHQGAVCAKLVDEILDGKKKSKINYAELAPMVRQSCGCISPECVDKYKDFDGFTFKEKTDNAELLTLYMNETFEKKRHISLLDVMRVSNTMRQIYFNSRNIIDILMVDEMRICLYDESVYFDKAESFPVPKKAELLIYVDVYKDKKFYHPEIFFDPTKTVSGYDDSNINPANGSYIIYPIYSENKNYGYMLVKPRKENYFMYTVSLKITSAFIAQAVEYTASLMEMQQLADEKNRLLQNNDTLTIQNKTDELTQILNRRGFLELGQRTLDVMQEMAVAGVVFFGDIDGLKQINDKYGHQEGDRAITLIAKVLKKAFRQSDVVGRLSGDEFGIVANGMKIEQVDRIRAKIEKLCEECQEKNNLPYHLGISLGATDLEPSSILSTLLTHADKSLYEQKKIHHGK